MNQHINLKTPSISVTNEFVCLVAFEAMDAEERSVAFDEFRDLKIEAIDFLGEFTDVEYYMFVDIPIQITKTVDNEGNTSATMELISHIPNHAYVVTGIGLSDHPLLPRIYELIKINQIIPTLDLTPPAVHVDPKKVGFIIKWAKAIEPHMSNGLLLKHSKIPEDEFRELITIGVKFQLLNMTISSSDIKGSPASEMLLDIKPEVYGECYPALIHEWKSHFHRLPDLHELHLELKI